MPDPPVVKQQNKAPAQAKPNQNSPRQNFNKNKDLPEHISKKLSPTSSGSMNLNSLKGMAFSSEEGPQNKAAEDKPFICTGCGLCGKKIALKDAKSISFASLKDSEITLSAENVVLETPSVPDSAMEAGSHENIPPPTITSVRNESANSIDSLKDSEITLSAENAILVPVPPPAAEERSHEASSPPTINSVANEETSFPQSKSETAAFTDKKEQQPERIGQLDMPASPSLKASAPGSQANESENSKTGLSVFPMEKHPETAAMENTLSQQGYAANELPQNQAKNTESREQNNGKKFIIGSYTYNDIIASAWLRKLYGHMVGLPPQESAPQKKEQPPSTSIKKPDSPRQPSPSRLDEEKRKMEKTKPDAKHEKNNKPKTKHELPGQGHKSHKPYSQGNQEPGKPKFPRRDIRETKNIQKAKKLLEKLEKIKSKIRKLEKEEKSAKDNEKKKKISLKIKKLALKETKLQNQLDTLNKKLKAAENHAFQYLAREAGKISAKTRLILEKFRKSGRIPLAALKTSSRKELMELKKLLENRKILLWILMGSKEKKRRPKFMQKIKKMLGEIGKLLNTR